MYARVVTWEGGSAEEMREAARRISSESGPPEGVPSTGFTLLIDPEGGRTVAIGLFESEDDYRKGDETLNSMNPPAGSFGRRISVEKWEVGFDARM